MSKHFCMDVPQVVFKKEARFVRYGEQFATEVLRFFYQHVFYSVALKVNLYINFHGRWIQLQCLTSELQAIYILIPLHCGNVFGLNCKTTFFFIVVFGRGVYLFWLCNKVKNIKKVKYKCYCTLCKCKWSFLWSRNMNVKKFQILYIFSVIYVYLVIRWVETCKN